MRNDERDITIKELEQQLEQIEIRSRNIKTLKRETAARAQWLPTRGQSLRQNQRSTQHMHSHSHRNYRR